MSKQQPWRTTSKKSSPQPKNRLNKRRLSLLVAVVTVMIILIIALCVRLFGSVDMTSSDRPSSDSSETSAATSTETTASATTATTASSSSKSTKSTTKSTTSSTKTTADTSGHYVQPAGAAWNLKLVNAWNTLDSNYAQNLVAYKGDSGKKFDSRAIDQLNALVKAGAKYNVRVASTYRPVEKQRELFEREVNELVAQGKTRNEAEKLVATEIARPGTSEHNLGLAVDLLFENYSNLATGMKTTDAYRWLIAHCADYGFILRFPENTQAITNITFEPWHYRYVGVDAAKAIMSRGITLEEYLQELGQ